MGPCLLTISFEYSGESLFVDYISHPKIRLVSLIDLGLTFRKKTMGMLNSTVYLVELLWKCVTGSWERVLHAVGRRLIEKLRYVRNVIFFLFDDLFLAFEFIFCL